MSCRSAATQRATCNTREDGVRASGACAASSDAARRNSVPARTLPSAAVYGLVAFCMTALVIRGAGGVEPPIPSGTAPFGIDQLAPFTSSLVVGSPDPPLPYRVKKVFGNLALSFPIAVVREPDSDRLVCLTHDSGQSVSRIMRFVDTEQVTAADELLRIDRAAYDLTFHPDFKNNGYLYVGTNGSGTDLANAKTTRVTRYTMDRNPPFAIDPQSELMIIEWPSDGHNGGAVAFGHDGMLYVTSGDGTSDSDSHVVGQDLGKLTAKVLRLDVDQPDIHRPYAVPPDNPFVATPGARGETWAYGLRNPCA